MTQLPLDDPKIEPLVCEFAGTSMTKGMDVYPFSDPSVIPNAMHQPAEIGVIEPFPLVRTEEKLRVYGPDGGPLLDVPQAFLVNSNDTPLASLTVQYSNGASARVDIIGTKVKALIRTEHSPPQHGDNGTIPFPGDSPIAKHGKHPFNF